MLIQPLFLGVFTLNSGAKIQQFDDAHLEAKGLQLSTWAYRNGIQNHRVETENPVCCVGALWAYPRNFES